MATIFGRAVLVERVCNQATRMAQGLPIACHTSYIQAMSTMTARMDTILAELSAREAHEFRRAIDLFEKCGVMTSEEATEWRQRFAAWFRFRSEWPRNDSALS